MINVRFYKTCTIMLHYMIRPHFLLGSVSFLRILPFFAVSFFKFLPQFLYFLSDFLSHSSIHIPLISLRSAIILFSTLSCLLTKLARSYLTKMLLEKSVFSTRPKTCFPAVLSKNFAFIVLFIKTSKFSSKFCISSYHPISHSFLSS